MAEKSKQFKLILSQDDRAPDSMEVFKENFKEKVGVEFQMWITGAIQDEYDPKVPGFGTEYIKGDIRVLISADDPFYRVYKYNPDPEA
jgi:hypothetical protein